MVTLFSLLIIYQLKHFIADFPLQGKYMLGKFKDGTDWIAPLLAHVAVHGFLTGLIVSYFKPELMIPLVLLDMTIHFIMDRIKASPNMLGRFKALAKSEYMTADEESKKSNTYFWWSLGLDQMVHHLTHYIIIFILVM